MSKEEEELERLRKLREKQITARDPTVKEKKLHGKISVNAKKHAQYSLRDAINDIPAKWLYMIVAALFGIFISIIFVWLVPTWWAGLVSLVIVLVFALIGRVIGLAEDFRKE